MFLQAFTDELVKTAAPVLRKSASLFAKRPDRLVERLAVTGALSSGALHGASKVKAALTANPYDGPEGSVASSLGKGAVGGLLAAAVLKALGRMHGRPKH